VISRKDIFSYNKEQSNGDGIWNSVMVNMRLFNLDVNEAIERVYREHQRTQARLLELVDQLPRFSPEVDKDLREYIDGILDCVRGNHDYSITATRYFTTEIERESFRRTGQVPLRPKEAVVL
jgi:hypothetical protein